MHISVCKMAFKGAKTNKLQNSFTVHHAELVVGELRAHLEGAFIGVAVAEGVETLIITHLFILPHT